MQGDVRYNWAHGITDVTTEVVERQSIHRAERTSVVLWDGAPDPNAPPIRRPTDRALLMT